MAEKKKTPKITKTLKKLTKTSSAKPTLAGSTNFQKLNLWNKVLAGLYVVQAVLLVVFAKAMSLSVSVSYSAVDTLASDAAGHEVMAPVYRNLFDVRIAWALAVVLLIFALGHILMATIYRKRYELDLQAGINRWRWATIGLGGGALLTVVCLLSGIQQLGVLLAVLLFGCLSGILVLLTERFIAREGKKTQMEHMLCALSLKTALFAWVILIGSAVCVWVFDGKLPVYMYGVYGSLLVFSVAIMFVTHYRLAGQGRWKDTFYTERVYMLLALVATALVVWQVYLGALR